VPRISINQIRQMKKQGEKIAVLTAYDYSTAKIVDEAGVPLILVGDSLGMVILGYDSTVPVTMADMLHHTKAVARGAKNALIIGDMPYMTYYNNETALLNAARFIQEGGAQAVKLEGGVTVANQICCLVDAGIPVCAHIGFTPQSVTALGGYHVQGKTLEAAQRLAQDAQAVDAAGAFAVVLEMVPAPLAAYITRKISIPTIGIGAGAGCDGQVQVINDMLGSFTDFVPKHAKQFAKIAEITRGAVSRYLDEVKSGQFPTTEQSFTMDENILQGLR
jgi:3-methyl-2-oxobutanoate hydroxymethyltransferase